MIWRRRVCTECPRRASWPEPAQACFRQEHIPFSCSPCLEHAREQWPLLSQGIVVVVSHNFAWRAHHKGRPTEDAHVRHLRGVLQDVVNRGVNRSRLQHLDRGDVPRAEHAAAPERVFQRHFQGWAVRSLPPPAPHPLGRRLSVRWTREDQLHVVGGRQAPLDAHVLKGTRELEARGRVGREGLLDAKSRPRQEQHWATPRQSAGSPRHS